MCADDACGALQSQVTAVLEAGTHRVFVGGKEARDEGPFTLHLWAAPVNGPSLGTIPPGSFTLTGAIGAFGGPRLACQFGPNVWFSWMTCPGDPGGPFTASTCNAATAFDSILELAEAGGVAACNDDSCGLQSQIAATIAPGAGLHVLYVGAFVAHTSGLTFEVDGTRP